MACNFIFGLIERTQVLAESLRRKPAASTHIAESHDSGGDRCGINQTRPLNFYHLDLPSTVFPMAIHSGSPSAGHLMTCCFKAKSRANGVSRPFKDVGTCVLRQHRRVGERGLVSFAVRLQARTTDALVSQKYPSQKQSILSA